MRRISKIEIKNYRSIKTETVYNVNDLNVFSGGNDVGKSNVLRALDMFFNEKRIDFQEEFNIDRKAEIQQLRQKQIISVKITFINDSYKHLPASFFVKKTWDKTGKMITQADDIETWRRKQEGISEIRTRTSLSLYLNKFKFRHIPAIKDNSCFNLLLVELYNAIVDNTLGSAEEFEMTLSDFNSKLAQLSEELSAFFLQVAGIRSTIAIPTAAGDLARRLAVSTYAREDGDDRIPLFNRGDGVRMHYIPSILNFISSIEKNKWHIWAIDEPETSCEYSKSAKLSHDFLNTYSSQNQIFIASHSFHFISLTGDNVSRYRVFNHNGQSKIRQINNDLFEDSELKSELGVFSLLDGLQEVYDKYNEERQRISESQQLLNAVNTPLLLFEGKSDTILFRKAIGNLFPAEIDNYSFPDENNTGQGARWLQQFLTSYIQNISEIEHKRVIAIFDNDEEGKNQFNSISGNANYHEIAVNNYKAFKHKKYNVFAFCLIAPDFRANFVHDEPRYCLLSTELLLPDNLIPDDKRTPVPYYAEQPPIFSIKNTIDKASFANGIAADADYSGFANTIDQIRNLVNYNVQNGRMP